MTTCRTIRAIVVLPAGIWLLINVGSRQLTATNGPLRPIIRMAYGEVV